MRIGVSQLVVADVSTEEFFGQASAAGYEVVELALKREGDLTPEATGGDLGRLVDLSKKHGLEIVSVVLGHLTGSLLESGEAQSTGIKETLRGLEIAAALGASSALHTLGRLRPELYYDDAYHNGVAALKELAPKAEELDVAVAVEFVWNGFLFSPMEMARFLDEVASSHVGFYFDPGNMAVFQYPHHWVRILGPRTKMVHLKDWRGRALDGGWTPLLEGEVDFEAVRRELRATGYDGPVISEVSPGMASLPQTAQAMRKIVDL